MEKFIAHANVVHLREILATEQDETKRQTLQRLLAEEEAKMAGLGELPKQKRA